MTTHSRYVIFGAVALLTSLAGILPLPVSAQFPLASPATPGAQRNTLNIVRTQVNWLQSATRTAPNYGAQGAGNVWGTFQGLRQAYNGFKATLTPQQLSYGANQLAELDAGLDILQEAFVNYDDDLARGQSVGAALNSMCSVLRQGSDLWLGQFNKTTSRLRVGMG